MTRWIVTVLSLTLLAFAPWVPVANGPWVPVAYAVAMGIDALAALLFGRLFDRMGLPVLIIATVISAPFALLTFSRGVPAAFLGMALWGVGMGAQESIMRAAIAEMVPASRRGAAYGVFNAGYGVFWFAGSAAMGVLYDISVGLLIGFSVVTQLGSIPLLLLVRKEARRGHQGLTGP